MSRGAPIITLDGPGGAGKGTLAARIAEQLAWPLLDSGALYRLVGLCALRDGLDPERAVDRRRAEQAARALRIRFVPDSRAGQRVELAGEDVTRAIRSNAVSQAASRWAVQPPIRAALLARQRAFAAPPGLIADGRDMGTAIFPGADLKIFITASAAERAERRYKQLSDTGIAASVRRIYREILERDRRDASRTASPLRPAADAHIIDTTGETVAASWSRVRDLVAAKGWLTNA